jgi:hypothetical protein
LPPHEAGHVFAAFRLRVPFKSVSIEPDDDSLGRLVNERLRIREIEWYSMPPRTRDRLERLAMVSLAGEYGERLVSKRVSPHSGSIDRRNVARVIVHLCGSTEEATPYVRWLDARTKAMINAAHNRPAIDAVAAALLERRTLSAREAAETIINALTDRRSRLAGP